MALALTTLIPGHAQNMATYPKDHDATKPSSARSGYRPGEIFVADAASRLLKVVGKMARVAWALLARSGTYRVPAFAAA
jgi:hypothetical protein